jgi:hypothetical protein
MQAYTGCIGLSRYVCTTTSHHKLDALPWRRVVFKLSCRNATSWNPLPQSCNPLSSSCSPFHCRVIHCLVGVSFDSLFLIISMRSQLKSHHFCDWIISSIPRCNHSPYGSIYGAILWHVSHFYAWTRVITEPNQLR